MHFVWSLLLGKIINILQILQGVCKLLTSHTLTSISSILSNMLSKVGPCSCFSASASATCCLWVTHRAWAASSRRSSRRASLSTSALAPGCQHLQHNTAKNWTALFIFHCYFKLILITFSFCVNISIINLQKFSELKIQEYESEEKCEFSPYQQPSAALWVCHFLLQPPAIQIWDRNSRDSILYLHPHTTAVHMVQTVHSVIIQGFIALADTLTLDDKIIWGKQHQMNVFTFAWSNKGWILSLAACSAFSAHCVGEPTVVLQWPHINTHQWKQITESSICLFPLIKLRKTFQNVEM